MISPTAEASSTSERPAHAKVTSMAPSAGSLEASCLAVAECERGSSAHTYQERCRIVLLHKSHGDANRVEEVWSMLRAVAVIHNLGKRKLAPIMCMQQERRRTRKRVETEFLGTKRVWLRRSARLGVSMVGGLPRSGSCMQHMHMQGLHISTNVCHLNRHRCSHAAVSPQGYPRV